MPADSERRELKAELAINKNIPAAFLKALRTGDDYLANRIYSGVPADMLGREQVISVGPMSGEANVVAWFEKREISCTPDMIKSVLSAAKESNRVLTEDAIYGVIASVNE